MKNRRNYYFVPQNKYEITSSNNKPKKKRNQNGLKL